MESTLLPTLIDFMHKQKIDLSLSQDNTSEFSLDDKSGSITIRFKINEPEHEILYNVYSPEFSVHLREETIKDVERLEFLAEENRRWKIAELIEDIWLILDQIKIWGRQNNFRLKEKINDKIINDVY